MQNFSLICRMSTLLASSIITDVWSHIGWCCSAQAYSPTTDFPVTSLLVADWCSLIWAPKAFLVVPMYSFPQLQGTLYTTPDLLRGGSTSLTLVSCCLSVHVETMMNAVLMSNLLRLLLRSSLIPNTYYTQILLFGFFSSSCLFVYLCTDMIMCTGYPLAFRTSSACFTSSRTFSPLGTVLTQLNRHEATPLLTCWEGWQV